MVQCRDVKYWKFKALFKKIKEGLNKWQESLCSCIRRYNIIKGFPGGSEGKESACNVGDLGSIPGLGRSPGEGNGNPLQYSCLENPMDRGAWWATVHGVAKSRIWLSDFTSLHSTWNVHFFLVGQYLLYMTLYVICWLFWTNIPNTISQC